MPQIVFTLLVCSGIESEDTISKNDLYGVIKYGSEKVKTEVASDGLFGAKYKWDQTFNFDATDDNDIEVRLFDNDIGFDDFIGKAVFNLSEAKANGTAELEVGVVNKDHEQKGTIKARIQWMD